MKFISPRVMGSRATWVAAGVNQSELWGSVLQSGDESGRRSQGLTSARNLDGFCSFSSASNQHRAARQRQGRQHKRKSGDHRLVRILAAGHGTSSHSPMIAIRVRISVRWSSLPMMMLGNIAVVPSAAGHGVARPNGAAQRRIHRRNSQQAQASGKNSIAAPG